MVFRLPTPFDSVIPASNRNLNSRPWRGTFTLHGIDLVQGAHEQPRLFIASAETEGDNRTDLWPKHFDAQLTQPSCRLSELQAWIRAHDVPLCMFMPDRHAQASTSRGNESHFRSLAQLLIENQLVCVAPWSNSDILLGSGILILPNPSSTGLLIGAVFLQGAFPDILFSTSSRSGDAVPSGLAMAQPYPSFVMSSSSSSSQSQAATRQPSQGPSASGASGSTQSLTSQRYMHGGYHRHYPSINSKEPTSPTAALRHALSVSAFDPFIFDDTTDGSGATSPGSTRAW